MSSLSKGQVVGILALCVAVSFAAGVAGSMLGRHMPVLSESSQTRQPGQPSMAGEVLGAVIIYTIFAD